MEEYVNKRLHLIDARLKRHMRQQDLAELLGVSKMTVNTWENAKATPLPRHRLILQEIFNDKDPDTLFTVMRVKQDAHHSEQTLKLMDMYMTPGELASYISPLLEQVGQQIPPLLETLYYCDVSMTFAEITSEEFFERCDATLFTCFQLIKGEGLQKINALLISFIPAFALFAESSEKRRAASVMVRIKILQIILAMHALKDCEMLYLQMMQFAEWAEDPYLYAIALYWQGMSYLSSSPQRAITIFHGSLTHLGEKAGKAVLCLNMAWIYATQKQERSALTWIEQAKHSAAPAPLMDVAIEDLLQREGQIYLLLEEQFPEQGYLQKAGEAFDQVLSTPDVTGKCLVATLLCSAQAALLCMDMEEYFTCLTSGMHKALSLGSLKLQEEARVLLGKAPSSWQDQEAYQQLLELMKS